MADFYVTEWLIASAATPRAVRRLAQAAQDALVAAYAPVFVAYGAIAMGGELRHHLSGTPDQGRSGSGKYLLACTVNLDAAQVYRDAAEVFRAEGWAAAYGGEPWAVCADTYAAFHAGHFTLKMLCDRVFSLEHNGGSFLDKVWWGGPSLYKIQTVGACHSNASTDDAIGTLALGDGWSDALTSEAVTDLWRHYRAGTSPSLGCDYAVTAAEVERLRVWHSRHAGD